MRLLIDMQGAQTGSRFRGIGRYTLSLVKEIVKNRGDHEILLLFNSFVPETYKSICSEFEGLLPRENCLHWHVPGPVRECEPENRWRLQAAQNIRQAFIESLCPDMVLVTSLFEGYGEDAVTSLGPLTRNVPEVVILYDLIPLLNSDVYLKPLPLYEKFYMNKLRLLKKASCILAISSSSLKEARDFIGENVLISNISSGCDAIFSVKKVSESASQKLKAKFGIKRPFVIYSGGVDFRKNVPRLIEAYGMLPSQLKDKYHLLLVGKLAAPEEDSLSLCAEKSGLDPESLLFTGYVSDEELAALYTLATLLVFPSWHEGFGLPVLEAMSCGTPVICSDRSSLPEVIGRKDAMFDPFSEASISSLMKRALTDESFLNDLAKHGPVQAKRFSWEDSALKAWKTMERLAPEAPLNTVSWSKFLKVEGAIRNELLKRLSRLAVEDSSYDEHDMHQIAAAVDFNMKGARAFHRKSPLPERLSWRLEGPFDSSYSLALVNRETASALAAMGHQVSLHSTEGPGDFEPDSLFLEENPDVAAMHRLSLSYEKEENHVCSRNLFPPRVSDMRCRNNLMHGYAWEESGFPWEWAESFNDSLQGCVCVSGFVKDVLINNGVSIPLAVSGNGVDHWERVPDDHEYDFQANSFRFLHVSSCFPRKGVDVLLSAYGMAFKKGDDVTLVIKTFPNPHNSVSRQLEELRQKNPDYPHVLLIEQDIAPAQLKSLYCSCHVMVAPGRGEGFGLPLAEAMLSGLAVITTAWGGQMDFCSDDTCWLVDYNFEYASSHLGLFDSVWAEPDATDLADKMRQLYSISTEKRNRKATAGRKLLLERFKWSDVAGRLSASARKWADLSDDSEPSLAWISTWNQKCGIATYSQHLVENMPVKPYILAPYTDLTLVPDDSMPDVSGVSRCWNIQNDNLRALYDKINSLDSKIVVIQFNYGFFNFESFSPLLYKLSNDNRVTVVMLHSTNDPKEPGKRLEKLVPGLSACSRVLVHSPKDLNRLKSLGIVKNAALFPHGVRDYKPEAAFDPGSCDKEGFVIASYGFFLPHKGLMELIEAAAILNRSGTVVRLDMINAQYPLTESEALIEKAKERILELGIEDLVNITTDFLPDRKCLDRLSKADLVVFPYQDTGESASGAVRYGLAAGRPVAVSPVSIFDDVRDAVFTLPGTKPADIASGIQDIINGLKARNPEFMETIEKMESWLTGHRYHVVGMRLYSVLVSLFRNRDGL